MRFPSGLLPTALIVTALTLGAELGAQGASRPPQPPGSVRVADGHVPGVCTDAQFKAGAPTSGSLIGVYYSNRSRQWISAPVCHARWGNLYMSASTVVKAGGKVTMTAIPETNSAQYAPETKSISWQFPGKRTAGCGNADLTCTVIVARKSTKEWQWGEFRVSMPRVFFIDSPGSNCAGQHLCAGFATNAWGWAGVPPRGLIPLSGRVTQGCKVCGTVTGAPAVTIKASGEEDESAKTGEDGGYAMALPKGKYAVSASAIDKTFTPKARKLTLTSAKRGVDFATCAEGEAAAARAQAFAAATTFTWSNEGQSVSGRYPDGAEAGKCFLTLDWSAAMNPGCSLKNVQSEDFRATLKTDGTFTGSFDKERQLHTTNGTVTGKILRSGKATTGIDLTGGRMNVRVKDKAEDCFATITPKP